MNEIELLYENREILLCVKHPGLDCEGDAENSILTVLRNQRGYTALYAVHRLDRGTGGVFCAAKTPEAASKYAEIFAEHQAKKTYLAAVSGIPSDSEGQMTDSLFYLRSKQKSYVVDRGKKGAKQAKATYRLLSTSETEHGPISLLSVNLETGRTHQIRIQLASRKLPILGDGKYGSRDNHCHTALWCHSLSLPNGITVTSNPPDTYPWNRFPDFRPS